MWNRADTIVIAWKRVMAAAVAIVGSRRLRVDGVASQSPARAKAVSPKWARR